MKTVEEITKYADENHLCLLHTEEKWLSKMVENWATLENRPTALARRDYYNMQPPRMSKEPEIHIAVTGAELRALNMAIDPRDVSRLALAQETKETLSLLSKDKDQGYYWVYDGVLQVRHMPSPMTPASFAERERGRVLDESTHVIE